MRRRCDQSKWGTNLCLPIRLPGSQGAVCLELTSPVMVIALGTASGS